MSPNERTIERCMEAFRRADRAAGVACRPDDVAWHIPAA